MGSWVRLRAFPTKNTVIPTSSQAYYNDPCMQGHSCFGPPQDPQLKINVMIPDGYRLADKEKTWLCYRGTLSLRNFSSSHTIAGASTVPKSAERVTRRFLPDHSTPFLHPLSASPVHYYMPTILSLGPKIEIELDIPLVVQDSHSFRVSQVLF